MAILGAAGALLAALPVGADAASGDLSSARIQGPWDLTVTVAAINGPTPTFPGPPVGHSAVDRIWFVTQCPGPANCVLQIWGPNGPDPAQASFFQFFSPSGFQGTPVSQPLVQSGSKYSATFGTNGFGGPVPCVPSGAPAPQQSLQFEITEAAQKGGSLLAQTLKGSELFISGWGCSGSSFTGWNTTRLSLSGHPAGYVAPAHPATAATSSTLTVSAVASALDPPAHAFHSLPLIVANLVITALVILFVTFPAALFNQTLRANEGEIHGVLAPLGAPLRALRALRDSTSGLSPKGIAGFVFVVLAGGVLNGLLDPSFGLNHKSLITYLATVITLCFGVVLSWLVGYSYRRLRHHQTGWRFDALPLGLAIAAGCVLVTRLTDFQPGYFYGLVCGIGFVSALTAKEQGHAAALGTILTVLIAVLAWFGWAAVNPAARSGGGAPLVLLDDFLGALFVGGLVGNVVGLLPFKSLTGGTLVRWHRGVWAALFGISVFGLVQVLLHPEQGAVHPSSAPLVTAVLLFVGFAGGSLAFNRYFAWRARPTRRFAAVPSRAQPAKTGAASGSRPAP